jgi:hypothetical protein
VDNREDQTGANQLGEVSGRSWLWGLLLPIYFLLLLGCGIWLVTWGGAAPAAIWVAYGAALVLSIAGLLARRHIFGTVIDRRNYIDMSRAQWFGRRGRSRAEDTRER